MLADSAAQLSFQLQGDSGGQGMPRVPSMNFLRQLAAGTVKAEGAGGTLPAGAVER